MAELNEIPLNWSGMHYIPKTTEIVLDFKRYNSVVDSLDALPQDIEIGRLLERYTSIPSEAQRSEIRVQAMDVAIPLFSFGHRFVVKALRTTDENHLRSSLLALCIEDVSFDYRETIGILVMVLNVCPQIGCNYQELCDALRPIASNRFTQFLQEFSQRPPSINTLAMMGLTQSITSNGPIILFGH